MWKKIVIKAVVLIVLFSVTVLIVDKINNRGYDDVAAETDAPVLPIVYTEYEGQTVNRLSGYTGVIDTGHMRETVIAVDSNKQINLLIRDDNEYMTSAGYELRDLSGENLIEEGELSEPEYRDGYAAYSFGIRMDMEEGTEYLLVIRIDGENGEAAVYYTRVVRLDREYLSEGLALVAEFNDRTFAVNEERNSAAAEAETTQTQEEADDIITQSMKDADDEENTTDLSYVNLYSSYDLLTWGSLNPDRTSEMVPAIKEVNEKYAVIELNYMISAIDDGAELNYNISEYYSIYYDESLGRSVLQGFDRYQEAEFKYNNISAEENSIILGVNRADNIEYVPAEDNRRAAFVTGGQLWLYDYRESTMTGVYGVWETGLVNVREIKKQHDINIMSIDEDGNICYVVYGYITRGVHEGRNGMLLMQYNHENAENTELAFIECAAPYDVLGTQVGKFTYYDAETGDYRFLLNNSIMTYNTGTGELSAIAENIPQGYLMVSDDMKVVAYPDAAEPAEIESITIYNFAENTVSEQESPGGVLYPIGFMGTDFIYGEAARGGIRTGADGNPDIELDTIYIADSSGKVIKTYHNEGIRITSVEMTEDVIYLERVSVADGVYSEAAPDYISYRADEDTDGIYLQTFYDETEYDRLYMVFPSYVYVQIAPRQVITKNKTAEYAETPYMEMVNSEGAAYLFTNAGYAGEFLSTGEAVMTAQNTGGIVTDSEGNVIFRHGEAEAYNTVAGEFSYYPCSDAAESLFACEYMSILSAGYEAVYNDVVGSADWELALAGYDGMRPLNISGADLDTALIYLSNDIPFTVRLSDGRYVLVVSYNSSYIRYYDPVSDSETRTQRRSFERDMESAGNEIYTYILY